MRTKDKQELRHAMLVITPAGFPLCNLIGEHMHYEGRAEGWAGSFYPAMPETQHLSNRIIDRIVLMINSPMNTEGRIKLYVYEGEQYTGIEVNLGQSGLTYEGARQLSNGVYMHLVTTKAHTGSK